MEDSYVIANFHSICRLCLQKSAVMVQLFDNADEETSGKQLPTKIADNFELQVKPNDGLPGRICYKCLYKVEKCSKFKLQCINNDHRLRQLTQAISGHNHSNSSEVSCNYNSSVEAPQKVKDNDYVVEDSVVMVVDPSLDYDSEESAHEGVDQVTEPSEKEDIVQGEQSSDAFFRNVFLCQYCDHAFITLDLCKQHESSSHNPNAPYNCSECGIIFAERSQHVQHMKIVHCNDKPYACPQCEKCFGRRSDLRKHSIVHTGIRPFQCQYCFKSFSRNTNLSKHLRIHSGSKPHVCPVCPRSFMGKGDLQRHVLVHSGMKPYKCQKCPLTFGRRDKLIKHEVKHNSAQEAVRESNSESDCQDMIVNVNPFSNLLTSPHQTDNYESSTVPDHILSENDFANEVLKMPSTSKKRPEASAKLKSNNIKKPNRNIKCHHCTKRFPSLDAYKAHISFHMGLRNFQCNICFKRFSKKKELDRHSATHVNNTKTFDCTQCEKKFSRKDKLVKHEETHDKTLVNMPCIECGKIFEKKSDLVAHIKSHITQDFEIKFSESDQINFITNADDIKYPGNIDAIKQENESDFSLEEPYYDMET